MLKQAKYEVFPDGFDKPSGMRLNLTVKWKKILSSDIETKNSAIGGIDKAICTLNEWKAMIEADIKVLNN